MGQWRGLRTVAQPVAQPASDRVTDSGLDCIDDKSALDPQPRVQPPSSGDCVKRLAPFHREMDERSTNRLQRRLKTRTPNLHRAQEKAQSECGWKGGDSSRANQVAGRSQSASRDTNYELEVE